MCLEETDTTAVNSSAASANQFRNTDTRGAACLSTCGGAADGRATNPTAYAVSTSVLHMLPPASTVSASGEAAT